MLTNIDRESIEKEYNRVRRNWEKHMDSDECDGDNCDLCYDYREELKDIDNRLCGN